MKSMSKLAIAGLCIVICLAFSTNSWAGRTFTSITEKDVDGVSKTVNTKNWQNHIGKLGYNIRIWVEVYNAIGARVAGACVADNAMGAFSIKHLRGHILELAKLSTNTSGVRSYKIIAYRSCDNMTDYTDFNVSVSYVRQ